MLDQDKVTKFVSQLPHVLSGMAGPTHTYQVSFPKGTPWTADGESCPESEPVQIRLDGTPNTQTLPGPLSEATIGSNFRCTETGQLFAIGVDIDGLNHSGGLTEEQLEDILAKLMLLDYLYIIRSRSGQGFHLYAFLAQDIITDNNSHARMYGDALARQIALDIGVDPDWFLGEVVDKAGQILFFYSPNPGQRGFEVVKEHTELFDRPLEVEYEHLEHSVVPLDDTHKSFREFVESDSNTCDKDFIEPKTCPGMIQCHTSVIERAYDAGIVKGKFETQASGSGDSKPNCYMYPIKAGRWLVFSFGNEPTWKTALDGKSYCIVNEAISLKSFAEAEGLAFNTRDKSYGCTKAQALDFAEHHGVELPNCPEFVQIRSSKTQVQIEARGPIPGWQPLSDRKCAIIIELPDTVSEPTELVRVAYVEGGIGVTPYRRLHGNYWHAVKDADAFSYLITHGLEKVEAQSLLVTDTPYKLVSIPLADEFPSRWEWNTSRTQLAYEPADSDGPCDHFLMILNHIGRAFDEAVAADPWCQANGIATGSQYLELWLASLFQHPLQPLPGIGLYSPTQDCGKSTFGYIVYLLLKYGYCNSERALTTRFNGQLEGVLLLDLDDVNLSRRNREIYNKLQPLMTSPTIAIEGKGKDERQIPNSLHFLHSANQLDHFAVRENDTRWILGEVSPLENLIPKPILQQAMVKEAPHFLQRLLSRELPEPDGRLFLPILDTPLKNQLMARRTEEELEDADKYLLQRLTDAAKDGLIDDWTTQDQLRELLRMDFEPQKFGSLWSKFVPILQNEGFEVGHKPNKNARQSAAYRIHFPSHVEA